MKSKTSISAREFYKLLSRSEIIQDVDCLEPITLPKIDKKDLSFTNVGFREMIIEEVDLHNLSFNECAFDLLKIKNSKILKIASNNSTIKKADISRCRTDEFRCAYDSFDALKLDLWPSDKKIGLVDLTTLTIKHADFNIRNATTFNLSAANVVAGIFKFYNVSNFGIHTLRVIDKLIIKVSGSDTVDFILDISDFGMNKISNFEMVIENDVNYETFNIRRSNFETFAVSGPVELRTFRFEESLITHEFKLSNLILVTPKWRSIDAQKASLKLIDVSFVDQEFHNITWSTANPNFKSADFETVDIEDDDGILPKIVQDKNSRKIFAMNKTREVYRSLKQYYNSGNNYFDALLFQNQELKIERQISSIKTWRSGWSGFLRNFGDWFLLFTNDVFSNFGLSWIRPLIIWLAIHSVLFYFMLNNFDLSVLPTTDRNEMSWEAFEVGSKVFLKVLFPIHDPEIKIKVLGQKVDTDVWGWLDFSMRVIGSYFLFLIIRGTRKFNFKVN